MEGFTHTENSLFTIYEKLKTINNLYQENLSEMHVQQRNQLTNLQELGMVLSSPQKDASASALANGVPPTSSLINAITQELDKLEYSYKIGRGQVEDAKFIGEALYRQFAQPARAEEASVARQAC